MDYNLPWSQLQVSAWALCVVVIETMVSDANANDMAKLNWRTLVASDLAFIVVIGIFNQILSVVGVEIYPIYRFIGNSFVWLIEDKQTFYSYICTLTVKNSARTVNLFCQNLAIVEKLDH